MHSYPGINHTENRQSYRFNLYQKGNCLFGERLALSLQRNVKRYEPLKRQPFSVFGCLCYCARSNTVSAQHIGENPGNICIAKYRKATTISSACFRCTDNYLQKQYTLHLANATSFDERIVAEFETIDDEQKNNYKVVDSVVKQMKFTKVEQ